MQHADSTLTSSSCPSNREGLNKDSLGGSGLSFLLYLVCVERTLLSAAFDLDLPRKSQNKSEHKNTNKSVRVTLVLTTINPSAV